MKSVTIYSNAIYQMPDPSDLTSGYLNPEFTAKEPPETSGTVVNSVIRVKGYGAEESKMGRILRVTPDFVSIVFREIAPVDLRLFNRTNGLHLLHEGYVSGLRLTDYALEWVRKFHPEVSGEARPDRPITAVTEEYRGVGVVYGFRERTEWDPDVLRWVERLRDAQYPRFRIPVRR